jgi:predicted PurR-regulated permease PerM
MDDNGKRAAKVPALLILASFIIVVAGMKAASSVQVPGLLFGALIGPSLNHFLNSLPGYQERLSTLVVFLSLVFRGWVLGPIGMILSVPMTSLVTIALKGYEDTRGFAIMLGSGTEIEWIEGMETADAIRREKKKDL